ncbi:hypothetical protein KI387_007831, partial [Taxus chinensis]
MAKLMDVTLNEGLLIKVLCIDARNPHTNGHYCHINHLRRWRKCNDNLSGSYPDLFKLVSPSFTLLFCNYPSVQFMGGQLKRLEPDNCELIKNDEEVWNILLENGIATFLKKMTGYSALVSYVVTASWSKGRVQIGNTRFTISTNAIADATSLPAAGTEASGRATSPVSSPDFSQAADLLGLAKLYLDSPDSEQCDVSQPVADPISQAARSKALLDEKILVADTLHSTPLMESNPADSEFADAKGDQCRTDMVSSILSKLQRAFKVLKAWEAFTESTRNAIANDCAELIKLADLIANDSSSPRAKNA